MKAKYSNYSQYVGKTINRLRIDSFIPSYKNGKKIIKACFNTTCINDGNQKVVRAAHVLNEVVKSCGCLAKENMKSIATKHGKSKSSEYNSYHSMKERCYNKNNHSYRYYGKRGIIVCERWLENFSNFLEDMGEKPSPKNKYSLDRIDVNEGYNKENCRWSNAKEQQNNRRNVNDEYVFGFLFCINKLKEYTIESKIDIPEFIFQKLKELVK